jgi:tetratricopeptide (TPR) repeat protein
MEAGTAHEQATLNADWSLTAHRQGDEGRAYSLARQALELDQATGDRQALAQAHNMHGILEMSQDDLVTDRNHLAHSLALAEALENPGAQATALSNLAQTWVATGDTARAMALAEAAVELCSAQVDRHREAALHSNLANLLHAGGEVEAALAHLKQAAAIFAEIREYDGLWQPGIWKLVECNDPVTWYCPTRPGCYLALRPFFRFAQEFVDEGQHSKVVGRSGQPKLPIDGD